MRRQVAAIKGGVGDPGGKGCGRACGDVHIRRPRGDIAHHRYRAAARQDGLGIGHIAVKDHKVHAVLNRCRNRRLIGHIL